MDVSMLLGVCEPASKATNANVKGIPTATKSRFATLGYDDALEYALNLIHTPQVTSEEADEMMHDVLALWKDHINPGFLTYRKSVACDYAAIEWRDGDPGGSTILSAQGVTYLDLLGGFGIYNVGHSHPTVVAAVKAQLSKAPLNSQELLDPLRAYCAGLLVKTLPGKELQYAFFTNSGTESVECALKMAMLSTGRKHFIGVLGAFHGKSLGSLSATSKAVFRAPFGSLLPFTHIPVNDCAALRAAFEAARFTGAEIAGFIVEPVLGEGGIWECSPEFLRLGRSLCDQHGARLIFDEVQSGMGRTGTMWACEQAGVAPDIMAVGKAFGGGVMAAGACLGTRAVWEKYFDNPFLHTTTFGGNPCAMAAAIATLSTIRNEGLVAAAATKGAYFKSRLEALAATCPGVIVAVRGRGLMLGLQFPSDEVGFSFAKGCFKRRILISGTLINSRVLRVEPPLTITMEEIDTALERMVETLEEVAALHGLPAPEPQHHVALKQPTPTRSGAHATLSLGGSGNSSSTVPGAILGEGPARASNASSTVSAHSASSDSSSRKGGSFSSGGRYDPNTTVASFTRERAHTATGTSPPQDPFGDAETVLSSGLGTASDAASESSGEASDKEDGGA